MKHFSLKICLRCHGSGNGSFTMCLLWNQKVGDIAARWSDRSAQRDCEEGRHRKCNNDNMKTRGSHSPRGSALLGKMHLSRWASSLVGKEVSVSCWKRDLKKELKILLMVWTRSVVNIICQSPWCYWSQWSCIDFHLLRIWPFIFFNIPWSFPLEHLNLYRNIDKQHIFPMPCCIFFPLRFHIMSILH